MQSRTIRFVASLSFFVLVVGLALLATACPPAPEATTFAVNYDANGATGGSAPDEQIKDAGVDIVLASNSGGLNRSGYRFLGWNDRADGSGQAYAEAAIYAADKDILLFAAWSVIPTYTVSYNSNGGTGGTLPPPQTKIQGLALTLASNTGNLARAGYSFWGWNTAADGTGTAYEQGSNYTQDASIILYASWTQGSFPVTYDDNYAHSGTPPSNQTKIQGQALIIATNSGNLGKTNHSFGGWNTQANAEGTDYPVGSSYSLDQPLNLYAKWDYNVVYSANGGTGSVDTQLKIHNQPLLLSDRGNMDRVGHSFLGWYTTASGVGGTAYNGRGNIRAQ